MVQRLRPVLSRAPGPPDRPTRPTRLHGKSRWPCRSVPERSAGFRDASKAAPATRLRPAYPPVSAFPRFSPVLVAPFRNGIQDSWGRTDRRVRRVRRVDRGSCGSNAKKPRLLRAHSARLRRSPVCSSPLQGLSRARPGWFGRAPQHHRRTAPAPASRLAGPPPPGGGRHRFSSTSMQNRRWGFVLLQTTFSPSPTSP